MNHSHLWRGFLMRDACNLGGILRGENPGQ